MNKQNVASLATHQKCGFIIEEENGINYLCGDRKKAVITRISQMEQYLDEILSALKTRPDTISTDTLLRGKIQALKDYYDSVQWLKDYECDERGELPADLKRGVLAEDTLYDLFSTLEHLDKDKIRWP